MVLLWPINRLQVHDGKGQKPLVCKVCNPISGVSSGQVVEARSSPALVGVILMSSEMDFLGLAAVSWLHKLLESVGLRLTPLPFHNSLYNEQL